MLQSMCCSALRSMEGHMMQWACVLDRQAVQAAALKRTSSTINGQMLRGNVLHKARCYIACNHI